MPRRTNKTEIDPVPSPFALAYAVGQVVNIDHHVPGQNNLRSYVGTFRGARRHDGHLTIILDVDSIFVSPEDKLVFERYDDVSS
jgi:hypothetical protein